MEDAIRDAASEQVVEHKVIYHLLDHVTEQLVAKLPAVEEVVELGTAQVLQVSLPSRRSSLSSLSSSFSLSSLLRCRPESWPAPAASTRAAALPMPRGESAVLASDQAARHSGGAGREAV